MFFSPSHRWVKGVSTAYRQVTAERSGVTLLEVHWVMKMPWTDWGTRVEGRGGMRDVSPTWNVSVSTAVVKMTEILNPTF